jgi:hypothetical protein
MNIKRNYRATVLFAAVAAVFAGWETRADNLTVETYTTINSTVTYDYVYVSNTTLRIGNGGSLKYNNELVLGSAENTESTLYFTGTGNLNNDPYSSAPIIIGRFANSKGRIDTNIGANDYYIMRVTIGGNAKKDSSGYIDFLRIGNGPMSGGHPARIFVNQWMNYASDVARVRFDGANGAFSTIASKPSKSELALLWADAKATYAFEGVNGANVVFGGGSWWDSPINKNFLTGKGKVRTQGDCDVIFHNHNAPGTYYGFEFKVSTNQLIWAHTGATIVSNNFAIKTSTDYALPNGPQTGRIEFKGMNNNAAPVIDLCGTTQIANGIYDATPGSKGAITNSSETAATLVLGAHDQNCDLKIGQVFPGVTIKKAGSGVLTVVASSLPAVNTTGGSFIVSGSNLTCGSLAQDGGAVGVVSGATFDLSGAPAGSNVLSHIAVTDGAGGGTFRGATLAASGVIDLSTATPTAEGFGEDTLAVSFADCANPENIQNWTVRVNGAGGNSLGAKISGGNLRIGKTATVIMMR